jgi:hypothetical protein
MTPLLKNATRFGQSATPTDHGVSLSARDEQVEQDRAPTAPFPWRVELYDQA